MSPDTVLRTGFLEKEFAFVHMVQVKMSKKRIPAMVEQHMLFMR